MRKKFLTGTVAGALAILAVTVNASEGPGRTTGASEADMAASVLTQRLNRMGLEVLGTSQPDSGRMDELVIVVRPTALAFHGDALYGNGRDGRGDDDDHDDRDRDDRDGRRF